MSLPPPPVTAEKDRMVAERFYGWKQLTWMDHRTIGVTYYPKGWYGVSPDGSGGQPMKTRYSTDTACALQLSEYLRRKHDLSMMIVCHALIGYTVTFHRDNNAKKEPIGWAEGADLADVIVRAALALPETL